MTNNTITTESSVVRRGELVTAEMDEDLVMMSLESNRYYGLDSIGKSIWALLEHPISVSDLCRRLAEEFEVSAEQCEDDVLTFLNELSREDLIRLVPHEICGETP